MAITIRKSTLKMGWSSVKDTLLEQTIKEYWAGQSVYIKSFPDNGAASLTSS